MLDDVTKADLIATANKMADAARPVALKYFRSPDLSADNKLAKGFDPVTIADRDAEKAMRAVLATCRPDDAIIGEEFGESPGSSGFTWVLDPIDGTRAYISGAPTWGMLIAVNQGGEPLLGLIDQPYIDERFFGGFGHASLSGPRGTYPLNTRATTDLDQAVIFTTFPELNTPDEAKGFADLAQNCKLTRYGFDCYAYALLAAGHIDLVVEAGLNSYDIQAPIAVITAAGGIVTDWRGTPAHNGGQVLAAATPTLHAKALTILRPYAQ